MSERAREHHWDHARAFYLLLGIPFHAAVVYSTHHVWSVSSPEPSPVLTLIADTLHTFRMPGFFILAGYFAMMMIARRGAGEWLGSRLPRLLVPLAVASLTILPFQILVSTYSEVVAGGVTPSHYWQVVGSRLTRFDEPWVSHLWFLYELIACSVGLAVVVAVFGNRNFRSFVARLGDLALRDRWMSFSILTIVAVIAAWLLPQLVALGGRGALALVNYNQYAIYFAFGVVVQLSAGLKAWHRSVGWSGLAVGLLLAEISMIVPRTVWSHAVFIICGVVAALLITGFVTRITVERFNRPNAVVKRIADASFTIYLFHHPVIFVLALAFVPVDWPPVIEFALIVPVAAAVSYLIHGAIAKSPLALFLFNGVPMPTADDREAANAPVLGTRR